jgi:cytochrome c-type biogenesis protein CcmH/NrfG
VLLARVHLARGDVSDARAEIEAALRLAPEHPEAKAIQASLPD